MKVEELAGQLFKPLRKMQLGVMVLVAIQQIMAVLQPYYMGKLIDNVQSPARVLLGLTGILIFLVAADFFFDWFQNYLWFKMDFKSMFLMRQAMFRQVLKNPFSFYLKKSKGDVVNRVMDDASQYAEQTILKIPMIAANVLNLLVVFIMLFVAQPLVGGILLAMCAVYFFSYKYINVKLRAFSAKEREKYSELLHKTGALYEGFRTIKLYNQEERFADKYYESAEKLCKGSVALQKWKSLAQSLSSMLFNLMPIIALVTGAFLIAAGRCTLGAVFSISSYVNLLGEPIRNLTDYNIMLQRGRVNGERLNEILPEKEEEPVRDEKLVIENISLQNVDFCYDGQRSVLKNFQLNMTCGDRIGIVGQTGSGKTTLLRLITGQVFPTKGEMLVNGKKLDDTVLDSYLERVAVVPQDIFLYDDTVMNNILFGRKADEARLSRLKEELSVSSYEEHEIGQLSGGERKRVGIARALLGDFDLLILDEPTADVDSVMEQKIIELIRQFTADGKILFVITHRPAILDICTKVVEMEGRK